MERPEVMLRHSLPSHGSSAYNPPYGLLLPLIHRSIKQSSSEPDIFLLESQDFDHDLQVAYASSSPHALLNAKVHAWSPNPNLPLAVWAEALRWKERWLFITVGNKTSVEAAGNTTVLRASSEVEAEIFVDVLAATKSRDLPALLEQLTRNVWSTMALVMLESLGKRTQRDKVTLEVEVSPQSASPSPTKIEMSSVDDLVEKLLELAINSTTNKGFYFVHVVNFNGLSQLETYTLLGSVDKCLRSRKLRIAQLRWSSLFSPSNERSGLGLALVNLPDTMYQPFHLTSPDPAEDCNQPSQGSNAFQTLRTNRKIDLPLPQDIMEMIRNSCQALQAAEPEITIFDSITGDGDCGYTLSAGAQCVLDNLPSVDFSNLAAAVNNLAEELQNSMGGTSGALYCIFLSSLSYQMTSESNTSFTAALKAAFDDLLTFTRARPGDRTCIDALAPFVHTLLSGETAASAADAAQKGADNTKDLIPKMGRSTYLDEKDVLGVPDPGAWALAILLKAMCIG